MNLFKNSIPCIALLAAACCVGAVPISAAVCADMIAGIVILFLLCNPFQLLRCLSARLRLCIACMIILILCAVQLSMLAVYARVYLHGCKGIEELSEQVSQLEEVQERFDRLQDKAQDMQDDLNDFRKEVENLYTENQRLREQGSEYRHALTASDEVIKRLREEIDRLRNAHVASEPETEPEKPAFSTAPASEPENQDSEILRLFESGMSLSQIGARFGISKSSAHAAKERAKKAQTA